MSNTDKGMPGATQEQENDPIFKVIWEAIKNWDIGISEYYSGHCLANGSHVALIMDALEQSVSKGEYHER